MTKLGAKHVNSWPEDWYVAREYRNFDLCVLNKMPKEFQEDNAENDTKDDGIRVLLVLENKVKSIPTIEQLHEYEDKILDINFNDVKSDDICFKWQLSIKGAKEHKIGDCEEYVSGKKKKAINCMKGKVDFLLLSMSAEFPENIVIEEEKIWIRTDYSKYLEFLSELKNTKRGLGKSILKDYCDQLSCLLDLHKEWTKDILQQSFLYFKKEDNKRSFYLFDYLRLKELRIHDLFQKQRYAKICSILKEEIQKMVADNYNELTCVSRLDLTKDDPKKKVNIGFNYFHGEPLLDIWLGTKDYVYTIQVQGESYEHGIHKRLNSGNSKGANSTNLWNEFWSLEDSNKEWTWMCRFNNPFDKKGEIAKDDSCFPILTDDGKSLSIFEKDSIVYPHNSIKRGNKYFPFLKYEMDNGVTFIYQYRRLSDQAKVDDVLKYIVADLKSICDREFPVNESPALTP